LRGEGNEKELNAVEFIQANCRGINENRSKKIHGLSVINGGGGGGGGKNLSGKKKSREGGVFPVFEKKKLWCL